MIGKTISHYKILEKLGEGGMGVVYKAEDTKLQRNVALKFLPQEWIRDPDAKARFMNEARAASALQHHNICTIHEIDETEDGQLFICMDFYEGQTVREKIERGPLKLDDTIGLAIQIAAGLAKAHQKTIVHRDLKPANVLVTEDGVAKILDFGLAKLAGRSMLTKEGTTLGTAAYMSPEQARGEVVDHRTDIFSLGVLIYEMVTGQLPFKGDYEQALVYSIMNEDPAPLTGLRTGVPMNLERAVFKCLEKAPDERYQSATDLLVDLKKLSKGLDVSQSKSVAATPSAVTEGKKTSTKSKRGMYTFGAVGVAGLIAFFIYMQIDINPKPIRLTNPQKITHAIGIENYPTWSPDGSKIAYASNQKGTLWSGWDIWMKQLSGGEPVNVTKDIASSCWWPSWSPDGSQIAFNSFDKDGWSIWVIPAIGGTPSSVAQTNYISNPVWSADGSQLSHVRRDSTGLRNAEIYTLSTYEKIKVTLPGEDWERAYLSWSPDGDFFAYTDADNLYGEADNSAIKILRIADGTDYQITNAALDFFPTWSLDSRLLYFISNQSGTTDLWQVKINADGSPDGNPEKISHGLGLQSLAFSPDGTKIAFSKEERTANLWRIPIPQAGAPGTQWTDAQQMTFESSTIQSLDISPDGKQVYLESDRGGNSDIWSISATGGKFRQLTTAPEDDDDIHLSPDGSTLVFVSERSGKREIWTMPAIGGPARQITNNQSPKFYPRWSPDGRTIAFEASHTNGTANLWIVPANGGEATQVTEVKYVFFPLWWPDGQSLVSIGRVSHWGVWRFPIAGGPPEPLTTPEFRRPREDDLRWSSDQTQIYFITDFDGAVNIWSLSVADGAVRQLTDFSGRYGSLGRAFTTEGKYFYFTWLEHTSDVWVMDVERD